MDADFVQSVARVGDHVEVRLITGDPFVGQLVELTLNRLVLQQADGGRTVLALAGILGLRTLVGTPPAEPAPAAPPAGPVAPAPPAPPAEAAPAAAAPAEAAPVAPPPAEPPAPAPQPPPAADDPVPAAAVEQPPQPAMPAPGSDPPVVPVEVPAASTAVTSDLALRAVASLPVEVSFDIDVPRDQYSGLHAEYQRYRNAANINELAPKFGRLGQIATGLRRILTADPVNGDLYHLIGVIELLNAAPATAQQYFATAADLTADPESWRLLAVAAAKHADRDAVVYALLRYFRNITPMIDSAAWHALLGVLDAAGSRAPLGDLLLAPNLPPITRRAVEEACPGGVTPEPRARPEGAQPRPIRFRAAGFPPAVRPGAPGRLGTPGRLLPTPRGTVEKPTDPAPRAPAAPARSTSDHFARADHLNKKKRDFEGAKDAYREEIRSGGPKRESAVKDLAWLTKRLDGAEAALRILEVEFPGVVPPGDSLDNILIDFYIAAGRYRDALEALHRQLASRDPSSSKGRHLLHQIAFVKFSAGQDSIPEWKTLLDATPANPAVRRGLAMAYVQQRTSASLDEAENLIRDDSTERADDIRRQVAAIRQGNELSLSTPKFIDRLFTSALVAYVMDRYSEQAAGIKDQRKRENKQPIFRDAMRLADNAGHSRGYQRENSADGYISAAAILREYGANGRDDDEDQLHGWLCSGLTALADLVLDRQASEAARDLYCEALAASERLRNPARGGDARLAIGRFFLSLDGRPALSWRRDSTPDGAPLDEVIAPILRKQLDQHGNAIFPLVAQLVAQTDVAAERVTAVIHDDPELRTAAVRHLGDRGYLDGDLLEDWSDEHPSGRPTFEVMREAWQRYGAAWGREQRRMVAALAPLHELTIAEDVIKTALVRLSEVRPEVDSDSESLSRIEDALRELLQFIYAESFEERDASLRRVTDTMKGVRSEVAKAPTSFAVEGVDPIAVRIASLVEQAQDHLLAERRPKPELALALAESNRDQHGLVTVQIEIRNKEGMAPLESGELRIRSEPDLFIPQDEVLRLTSAVSGGQHRVLVVKLRVSDSGVRAGAFSLPVTLLYRSRSDDEYDQVEASLAVQLADPSKFEEIHNPFFQGSTGAPVQDPEMFFGREELLDNIERRLRLAPVPGTGVAIFGQKRAGKSSIRFRLIDRLSERRESNNLIVVDLGNIGSFNPEVGHLGRGAHALLGELLWEILKRTGRKLLEDPAGAGRPRLAEHITREQFAASPQPVVDFISIIEDYFATLDRPPHIVVLIDEFQYFDEWIRKGLLPQSFMQALKAIIERRVFHLVVVGQDALERVIREHANVFVVFARERVTYLDDINARKLIERPILIGGRDGHSRYRQHAVDRIVELTGGSAFYIQKFCFSLVEQMNLNRAPLVTEADVELVREQLLDSLGEEDFDNLETAGYTEPDAPTAEHFRPVLLAVAVASRQGLATIERVQASYLGTGNLTELLNDLVIRDVVRKEGGAYRIVVRLYQDWLLMHHVGASIELGR
ncbi:hypothetical protein OOK41_09595 [Micromonospora sp. NBC_01655]|uniref:hypothetical protein n=1 Tax=Micromonospora sp. NBC_01655 TaxID=2975983 RepID=UPI00224E68AA|nr:hypothetical protein [Micromonospora sp. NBC_01655]MCX4470560.1 hypothetical protein [Micromonospora sp. NBC_01655]